MNSLQYLYNDFLHLFFPHVCAGCGSDAIGHESELCMHCIDKLPLTGFHLHAGNPVEKIFRGRIPVIHATAFCYFTKASLMQHLVHRLKYKGHKDLGLFMGRMFGDALKASGSFDDIDALLPLPLHAAREQARGYNQAAILCDGMASALGLPVIRNAVIRLTATGTQTQRNRIARWQHMEGRFAVTAPGALCGKHILLVDDMVTTGATLEACGQAVLTVGGTKLSIAALACGIL